MRWWRFMGLYIYMYFLLYYTISLNSPFSCALPYSSSREIQASRAKTHQWENHVLACKNMLQTNFFSGLRRLLFGSQFRRSINIVQDYDFWFVSLIKLQILWKWHACLRSRSIGRNQSNVLWNRIGQIFLKIIFAAPLYSSCDGSPFRHFTHM